MFTWIVPLMGGEFGVRFWHHTFLWFFVTFVIIHIYLAFYHDYIEGRGTVSSIIGGWKFERRSVKIAITKRWFWASQRPHGR